MDCARAIGVGDGGRGARAPPPKIREKYLSGNYHVKFGHFSGKYHKNSGILILFRAKIM